MLKIQSNQDDAEKCKTLTKTNKTNRRMHGLREACSNQTPNTAPHPHQPTPTHNNTHTRTTNPPNTNPARQTKHPAQTLQPDPPTTTLPGTHKPREAHVLNKKLKIKTKVKSKIHRGPNPK